jgi:hypothetical protein
LDQNKTYVDVTKEIKLFDLLKLLLEAWKEVSEEIIKNCYKKQLIILC